MPAATIYQLLVGYWKFDALDGAGNVPDHSNRDFVGVLTDAALDAGGRIGSGLRTSLSTGKMVVTDDLPQRQSPTNRVSVNIWINLDKALDTMWGTPTFLDKRGGGAAGYFLGVLPGGGRTVSFRVHNSAGTPYTASYTENATSGLVMITGVYEGATVRIYRNGISQATAVADGSLLFAVANIDNIGLGFEGVIDELSVWLRMLSAGDVTALYAGGAGLALVLPDGSRMRDTAMRGPNHPSITNPVDWDIPALPSVIDPDLTPYDPQAQRLGRIMFTRLDAPYNIIDSPRRIYVDPNPIITTVTVAPDHLITATANAGPTDAAEVTTWWQIEITPSAVFIVAERNVGRTFQVNLDQTDDWYVPIGQNWRNLYLTFYMQANEDASQVWSSDAVQLTNAAYNNASVAFEAPIYDIPVPVINTVSIDPQTHIVTLQGTVGPVTSDLVPYPSIEIWWGVEIRPNEYIAVVDHRTFAAVTVPTVVNDTFLLPVGTNWRGKLLRLVVTATYDYGQMVMSIPMVLTDIAYDYNEFTPQPLPPGPGRPQPEPPVVGLGGPGVRNKHTLDFTTRR